ncbi:DUF1918 domain-containing protein [Frankia casuarinae]|uniref:DUF1918 domain-containing protein n=1 Tax=Frankia casuarinae (strain DSM 45818 / CECT 9043 / HFP020203 / CcI3) TaxID=106370 RepID=UPI000A11E2CD
MRAHPGDTLVVHRHTTRQPDRLGEIFEVCSVAGDPPFAVRWSGTGHVSFVYPGPDAEIRHRDGEACGGAGGADRIRPGRRPAPHRGRGCGRREPRRPWDRA